MTNMYTIGNKILKRFVINVFFLNWKVVSRGIFIAEYWLCTVTCVGRMHGDEVGENLYFMWCTNLTKKLIRDINTANKKNRFRIVRGIITEFIVSFGSQTEWAIRFALFSD